MDGATSWWSYVPPKGSKELSQLSQVAVKSIILGNKCASLLKMFFGGNIELQKCTGCPFNNIEPMAPNKNLIG